MYRKDWSLDTKTRDGGTPFRALRLTGPLRIRNWVSHFSDVPLVNLVRMGADGPAGSEPGLIETGGACVGARIGHWCLREPWNKNSLSPLSRILKGHYSTPYGAWCCLSLIEVQVFNYGNNGHSLPLAAKSTYYPDMFKL